MNDVPGVIYLIHFETPLAHARHYLGWTITLEDRLRDHAAGRGANLMRVVRDRGIRWSLARLWTGTRRKERQIKNFGGLSRSCPICGVLMRKHHAPMLREVALVNQRLKATTPPANAKPALDGAHA